MCQRKVWTKQEDQLLINIMNNSTKKLKWNQIAEKIVSLSSNPFRKGKQCRERWFNQLHPNISKEGAWTAEQQAKLFQLQQKYGNHWAKISKQLTHRSDNNIKNYYYSSLRKSMRQLNNYVLSHKHQIKYKNIKAFQPNTLNKILKVGENKTDNKIIVGKQGSLELALSIKRHLVQLHLNNQQPANVKDEIMETLVNNIQVFNRICKRRKMKRRNYSSSEIEDQEIQPNSNKIPGIKNQTNNAVHSEEKQVNQRLLCNMNKNSIGNFQKQQQCQNKQCYNFVIEKKEIISKNYQTQCLANDYSRSLIGQHNLLKSNGQFSYGQRLSESFDKTLASQTLGSKYFGAKEENFHAQNTLNFIPIIPQPLFNSSTAFLQAQYFTRSFYNYGFSQLNPFTMYEQANANIFSQFSFGFSNQKLLPLGEENDSSQKVQKERKN